MRLSDGVCGAARDLIARHLGLAFAENRRAELERGLVRACHASAAPSPEAYLAWLAKLPDESREWTRLAAYLTVGETYFFRDLATLEALESHVLPSLIAVRRREGLRRLRLWSAGCATGEEPYTLAIMLDRLLPDASDWSVTILATDINVQALEVARRGWYRAWSFRETPASVRDRYFDRRDGDCFELDSRIRRAVTFAPLNLAQDGYPSVVTNTTAMDVILCRNVLMYFTTEAQRAAAVRLQKALVDGGWLGVAAAEAAAELLRPLVAVSFPDAILYRREAAGVAGATGVVELSPFRAVAPVAAEMPLALPVALESGEEVIAQAPMPSAPAAVRERARVLADEGKLDEAHALCEAALARDSLDLEAHLLLAAICQERGAIRPALEALRRAIYLAPDCAVAHFLLGSLLLVQGDRERGRRSMDTVVRLLDGVPTDEAVAGSDGLAAGRLLETARAHLESA